MEMMPIDLSSSWINAKNEFLPDMCSTDEKDDSTNSSWID